MVRDDIPGADPSRWTINPLINIRFTYMPNALTKIEHMKAQRDVAHCFELLSSVKRFSRILWQTGWETSTSLPPLHSAPCLNPPSPCIVPLDIHITFTSAAS